MSAPSPNADPERGEVPNTAAVVTRKWGTLRNFAANEEGRRKLNRAAAAPARGAALRHDGCETSLFERRPAVLSRERLHGGTPRDSYQKMLRI